MNISRITLLASALLCSSTWACSFLPGYELFRFGVPTPEGVRPDAPILARYEIKRGYDDKNLGSCSDAGILTLYFKHTPGVGYLFEPLKGDEDKIFPDEVVSVAEDRDHLFFVWLDGSNNFQEPIDLKVRVTAFNPNGQKSDPVEFHITHEGGRSNPSFSVLEWVKGLFS